jgi:hypothetical protein
MKISNETFSVLKNFASINTNLYFREGNTISTISTGKNIFARATVAETFDRDFAIYDLNTFLGLVTLMEDVEFDLGENSITASKDDNTIEYFYSDSDLFSPAPETDIKVDEVLRFNLSKEEIDLLHRAAGVTAASMITFAGDGSKVKVIIGDPSNTLSNSFKKTICESDKVFTANLQVENFKVASLDYEVSVSSKNVIEFSNNDLSLKYWIALHQSSEF